MQGTGVSYAEQGKRGIGGGILVMLAIMILAVLFAFGVLGKRIELVPESGCRECRRPGTCRGANRRVM